MFASSLQYNTIRTFMFGIVERDSLFGGELYAYLNFCRWINEIYLCMHFLHTGFCINL